MESTSILSSKHMQRRTSTPRDQSYRSRQFKNRDLHNIVSEASGRRGAWEHPGCVVPTPRTDRSTSEELQLLLPLLLLLLRLQ